MYASTHQEYGDLQQTQQAENTKKQGHIQAKRQTIFESRTTHFIRLYTEEGTSKLGKPNLPQCQQTNERKARQSNSLQDNEKLMFCFHYGKECLKKLTDFRSSIKTTHKVRCDLIFTRKHSRSKITKLQHILSIIDLYNQ